MTAFAYRAVNAAGRLQKGLMTAANENDLASLLRQQDMELIDARERREGPPSLWVNPFKPTLRGEERLLLCGQLRDLLKAGLPFAQALHHVLQAMRDTALRHPLDEIEKKLLAGASITQSFESVPFLFDAVALSILRAGEKNGDLAETFSRLARHFQEQQALRKQLRRAIRYPLFLMVVALSVTGFMMTFVVPQLIAFLTSLGTTLPPMTLFLISSADLFATLWWALPLAALTLAVPLVHLRRRHHAVKITTDRILLSLPVVGVLLQKIALSRLTASFALLIKAGLTLPEALETAAPTCVNAALEAQVVEAKNSLLTGKPLSQATATLFDPLITQRLIVAEKSGTLEAVLDDIAAGFETQAKESIDAFLGALEPALTLSVGGLLAWIVLAVLGPVYGSLTPLAQGM
ncbi:MAG: type II secretion system F family protein [Bdellovibrionales bacterium]|jgi:type IV pilus assembly protein PilC